MSLWRDEASAISPFEYLPTELFLPLFISASFGRHSETLKAMVQAWSYVCLPLREEGCDADVSLGNLQAVLDGLGFLLAQKDRPR